MTKETEQLIDRSNDDEIIGIIRSILSHGAWTIETINESVLVSLMEERGTPIAYHKTLRDIAADFERYKEDMKEAI